MILFSQQMVHHSHRQQQQQQQHVYIHKIITKRWYLSHNVTILLLVEMMMNQINDTI